MDSQVSAGPLWRQLLGLFHQRDAEVLHSLAYRFVRLASRIPGLLALIGGGRVRSPVRVGGLEFLNPVGLAAGFDKNCEWLDLLPDFGFGFAEIGTVTPEPQLGNPRPRLFRDHRTLSIRNRMGFNNLGAQVVSQRLAQVRQSGRIPATFRVGVNVGMNRGTELANAPGDYLRALSAFRDLVDFAVINVSSPNTPGLRELQASDALIRIVELCAGETASWSQPCPLWVKLAPEYCAELSTDQTRFDGFLTRMSTAGVRGWVLTNTLGSPEGGISGAPLRDDARAALAAFRLNTHLPLVSSGGILDLSEAQLRLESGAQLLEIYSGWVFGGPRFISRLARQLTAWLEGPKSKKP